MKFFLGICALLSGTLASAQSVALQGMLGNKALLIVDGSAPKSVAPGETFMGVKVVSTSRDEAVLEIDGRREKLRVGETPGNVGGTGAAGGSGSRIVMTAGSGGHFTGDGRINGQAMRFMVDTGATSVALGEADAKRMGVAYRNGRLTTAHTANGNVTMWAVRLDSVRIGDVEIRDVEASVLPADMPYVLLGNSFLGRFQMKRDNDQMVLERRY